MLGIDPGNKGGLALVDGNGLLLDVADAPTLLDGPAGRAKLSPALLADIVREWRPTEAAVEAVATRPGEGAVGAFSFGRALGTVEGILAALGIPSRSLSPPIWRRRVGLAVGRDKNASRAEAVRRWPTQAGRFKRKCDADRAEAALIAIASLSLIPFKQSPGAADRHAPTMESYV